MSFGWQGQRLLSFSVTGKRLASSSRTRRATNLVSMSPGFSSPPRGSRWYSTAQSSRGGYCSAAP